MHAVGDRCQGHARVGPCRRACATLLMPAHACCSAFWQLHMLMDACMDTPCLALLRLSLALQAKSLSLPGVTLMSEASLAELLGVSGCRLVMDGVAW